MVFSNEDKIMIKKTCGNPKATVQENLLRSYRIRTGTEKDWLFVEEIAWDGHCVTEGW